LVLGLLVISSRGFGYIAGAGRGLGLGLDALLFSGPPLQEIFFGLAGLLLFLYLEQRAFILTGGRALLEL
jgi:hypothetical protein